MTSMTMMAKRWVNLFMRDHCRIIANDLRKKRSLRFNFWFDRLAKVTARTTQSRVLFLCVGCFFYWRNAILCFIKLITRLQVCMLTIGHKFVMLYEQFFTTQIYDTGRYRSYLSKIIFIFVTYRFAKFAALRVGSLTPTTVCYCIWTLLCVASLLEVQISAAQLSRMGYWWSKCSCVKFVAVKFSS